MNAATSIESYINHFFAATAPVIRRLLHEESGQDLIEYALVFTFVGLGAVASMKTLGTKIATVFAFVGTTITSAT